MASGRTRIIDPSPASGGPNGDPSCRD